jgi:hypothetical protein
MASDIPPIRIAADPAASAALRKLVDHARNDLPEPSTLAEFATRLDAAIAAGVPGSPIDLPQPTDASGLVASKASLITVGVVISGIVAGSIWFGSRDHAGVRSQATTAMPSVTSLATPPSDMAPALHSAEPTVLVPAAERAPEGSPHRQQRTTNREATTEAGVLHSARALLTSNPRRALELTKEHARRFPKGDLVQEREVIAIDALRRLGQNDAAQQRGAAFEQQYPGSVHQSKVEQTLKDK